MSWQMIFYHKRLLQMSICTKRTYLILCAKNVGMRRTTINSTTHQECKTSAKLWSFGHSLFVTSQHDKESHLVQEKPFLWAQVWKLQQEWKWNALYKAHVSRSKQQSTKESFSSFRDRSQLSETISSQRH